MEDAAAAATWFAGERFAFLVAAQKYADHAREDVDKRRQLDYLLMTHPLLKVVHFESGAAPRSGARVVHSVCRDGRRVLHRVVIPGACGGEGRGVLWRRAVVLGAAAGAGGAMGTPGSTAHSHPALPPSPLPPLSDSAQATPSRTASGRASPRTRTTRRPSSTRGSCRRWT